MNTSSALVVPAANRGNLIDGREGTGAGRVALLLCRASRCWYCVVVVWPIDADAQSELASLLKELEGWTAEDWVAEAVGRIPQAYQLAANDILVSHGEKYMLPLRAFLLKALTPLSGEAVSAAGLDRAGRAIKAFLGVRFESGVEHLSHPADELRKIVSDNARSFTGQLHRVREAAIDEAVKASSELLLINNAAVLAESRAERSRALDVNRETVSLRQTIQELLAEAVLTREAKSFDNAQKEFRESAKNWILAAIACGCLLLAALAAFLVGAFGKAPSQGVSAFVVENLVYVGARVTVVGLLTTGLVICTRHYRAAKHNQVISMHRANSVTAVTALAKHGDERTRNALLRLAAQAVFVQAPTGYDGKDLPSTANLTGLFEGLSGRSGSDGG